MLRLFADLKFRWKIALPILVLSMLLMAMGLLAMRSIEHLVQSSTQLTDRSLPAVSLLLNADRDLYQAFIAERSLLGDFTAEHTQALRDSHRENLGQAHERVNRYATLQPSPEAQRLGMFGGEVAEQAALGDEGLVQVAVGIEQQAHRR